MERSIGQTSEALGLSRDTLRYYEKIGLVPRAAKSRGGRRTYNEQDVARLRFLQRAQGIGFSLTEIGQLLKLRENPVKCSRAVRNMAQAKCDEMEERMESLQRMQTELASLLSLCNGEAEHCPILDRLDQNA